MTLDLPRCPLRMCWACAAWCCVRHREKVAFAFQKAKAQDASGSDINGIERGYNYWENSLGYGGEHLGVSWDLDWDDPSIYGNFMGKYEKMLKIQQKGGTLNFHIFPTNPSEYDGKMGETWVLQTSPVLYCPMIHHQFCTSYSVQCFTPQSQVEWP